MRILKRAVGGLVGLILIAAGESAWAANAYPLFTSFQAQPINVGDARVVRFGAYTVNANAMLNGNQVLSITQPALSGGNHGVTFAVNVSNGENNIPATVGLPDTPNSAPVNPVFTAIGNPSGKLENGNVFRFSAWFRSDPANPITAEPQIAPIMKFEIWKEALGTSQDVDGPKPRPLYGDRLFDQDQQGLPLAIPDTPNYVDLNGDGIAPNDPAATIANGKVIPLATDHWTLQQVSYTIDSTEWLGIGNTEMFGANDVNVVESVQAIMFLGNFAGTVAGPGNLLMDNALIEVFKNQAAVTPLNTQNPNPTLSESPLGDYNGNHVVDAADYTVWRDTFGSQTDLRANGDTSGASATVIDAGDFTVWKNNFNLGSGSGGGVGGSSGGVPEPSTACLISLASAALALCIRRRR